MNIKSITQLLIFFSLLLTSMMSRANFSGSYATANWTPITQSFGCGSSTVNTAGMPDTLVLSTTGNCGLIASWYRLTGNVPANGTISFNWTYSGTAAGHYAGYTLNGTDTKLASGSGSSSGIATVPVTAGQTFDLLLVAGTSASFTVTGFSGAEVPAPRYTIGGAVSGLATGETVVLKNNGADDTTVASNTTFAFPTTLLSGAAYAVTVGTAPAGKTCTVSNGTGTVGSANVTNVAVACAVPAYTIGGTVSGLATGETVILKNNAADDKSVGANGSFTFTTSILSGAAYAVTVGTAPAGKTCTVSNGAGTVGSANVTNVAVACATPTSIPTLSEWGMIFLSSVIAMVGIATVRRRS